MKIATTHLELAATHVATRRHEARESLRTWAGEPPNPASAPRESVQFSPAALAAEASAATGPEGVADDEGHSAGDPRLTLIRTLIEMLTGRPVTVFDAAELAPDSPAVDLAVPPSAGQPAAGFSLEYDRHESLDESERTEFSASGTVQTADGKSIAFSVDLVMARAFHAESDVSLRLGEAARRKDPLVVNFGGNAASLTDTRFAFDLVPPSFNGDPTPPAAPQGAGAPGSTPFRTWPATARNPGALSSPPPASGSGSTCGALPNTKPWPRSGWTIWPWPCSRSERPPHQPDRPCQGNRFVTFHSCAGPVSASPSKGPRVGLERPSGDAGTCRPLAAPVRQPGCTNVDADLD